MKFGRNLPRNQVPEWAASYIDYKGLKKRVKSASEKARNSGQDVDPADFYQHLDSALEEVSSFYDKTLAKASSRLELLHGRYGAAGNDASDLDADEIEELAAALLELRNQLRNLQWFGEINRRGFVKITKKFDKKAPGAPIQDHYLETKVDVRPFAKGSTISPLLVEISQWLSTLRDAQNSGMQTPDSTANSLARFVSRISLQLSKTQLETLDHSIRKDDASSLWSTCEQAGVNEGKDAQALFHNLLQRAISARSKACITTLLDHITDLQEPLDINERNCLHRLVIHLGRLNKDTGRDTTKARSAFEQLDLGNKQSHPPLLSRSPTKSPAQEQPQNLDKNNSAFQILVHLLDYLKPEQRQALRGKDYIGRMPLHYAAHYGFVLGCELLMLKMHEWELVDGSDDTDAIDAQDFEGFAPFHLSAINGHALATEVLLQAPLRNDQHARIGTTADQSGSVLALATKADSRAVVQMLVRAGVDVNWTDRNGESALHVAARFGQEECARILLEGNASKKADLEVAEKLYAWTPLHVAAVDGHLGMVQLLVGAGADVSKADSSGWTAKEHAALRGHMDIARMLASHLPESESKTVSGGSSPPLNPTERMSIETTRSDSMNDRNRSDEFVKRFGHPSLTNESLVLVSLGSLDLRKDVEAVSIDRALLTEAYVTQLDTALSVVVSADGAKGDASVIDLPAQENIATEPIVFTTKDISRVRLLFDLIPTYTGSDQGKIGRAVALLSHVKPSLGSKRMNLQGDVCVPIMSPSFDVIGTVNFNFQVITPFSHPKMELTSKHSYWKKVTSTMLIGHRGLGKNLTSNRSLQLGENTLPSFIAAANLGAQYVEFDVQLTKDHVPVIYHDFLVSETGIDAPVHTLTLEQFLHINSDKSRNGKPSSNHQGPNGIHQRGRSNSLKPNRSRSMGFAGDGPDFMDDRMRHTRDFKQKGFKANSRGNFIQAPFATLEDLFRELPEDVGFNIEMKYPMLLESEEHEMDTYAVELNSFCDTVLSKVYDLMGDRRIIFSSFNPDVCLCLSFKQPSIPILFLTDAGCSEVSDVRASSLQEAIRFASRWNLLGVVSAAEPLINSPRLVRVVKENGLVCVSYGMMNNDPALVQRQVKEGIDAVIVDSVLAIRKGLTSAEAETNPLNGTSKESQAV